MRRRHELVEIEGDLGNESKADALGPLGEGDLGGGGDPLGLSDSGDLERPVLIDESHAPTPILREAIGRRKPMARSVASAIPAGRPTDPARSSLGWGLGTDGWPRHNSRLVRLLACDPEALLAGVAGRRWGSLDLGSDLRSVDGGEWPRTVPGWLQMPYPSPPLRVELHAQPFHDRYCRIDVVLCSQHRWPRRYFDVASLCLSEMRILERTAPG